MFLPGRTSSTSSTSPTNPNLENLGLAGAHCCPVKNGAELKSKAWLLIVCGVGFVIDLEFGSAFVGDASSFDHFCADNFCIVSG